MRAHTRKHTPAHTNTHAHTRTRKHTAIYSSTRAWHTYRHSQAFGHTLTHAYTDTRVRAHALARGLSHLEGKHKATVGLGGNTLILGVYVGTKGGNVVASVALTGDVPAQMHARVQASPGTYA